MRTKFQRRNDLFPKSIQSASDGFFSSVSDGISRILTSPPPPGLLTAHRRFKASLNPGAVFIRNHSRTLDRYVSKQPFGRFSFFVESRGVAGLIGANIFAFMLLNSRYMKAKSRSDSLPRVDRHFIASRYNLAGGRVWSVPLSIFNHSDSLFRLSMNCVGLWLVGPAVEQAFGPAVLVGSFLAAGCIGAIFEVIFGNHWCRGSSAGVTGLLGMGAFSSPSQLVSLWGVWDVRAISLAVSIFFVESCLGIFGSSRSEQAHIAHAAGLAASLPFLYYLRWFRL